MGVKYLTAYADSLFGDPSGVVRDLDRIPPFAAAGDAAASNNATSSNIVVLDASGGLARYMKPDPSERALYDYQEMFERVAWDVAAFRCLGYEPVAFVDATVPTQKLPVWKERRRRELSRQRDLARCVESPGRPLPLPKDCWVPPESGLQALADAFAAAGCEVHLGVDDVDAEAAAFCKSVGAWAVVTNDSDFFVADLGAATVRLWHWEFLGLSWSRGGGGAGGWAPPAGSPGVRAAGGAASASSAPRLSPAIPVREYRVDRLRERLRLAQPEMPLLAACLGNDGIAHITRTQVDNVLAEHPAAAAPSFVGGWRDGGGRGPGGSWRGGGGVGRGRGRGGYGGGGPQNCLVVESVARELARQLGGGAGAAAAYPPRPETARFVAGRVAAHGPSAREAYAPAEAVRPEGSFRAAEAGGAATGAPNVVRAVIARKGVMVKSVGRADDVRERGTTEVLREMRMRSYAGCGVTRVSELLYCPLEPPLSSSAARPPPPPPSLVPPLRLAHTGPLGETWSLLSALPAIEGVGTGRVLWQEDFVDVDVAAELAALGRGRAQAAAAAAAGGGANGEEGSSSSSAASPAPPPLPPLLPTSPEIVAASKSGQALAAYAAQELLRLELVTPVEAELIRRQADPAERARVREQAGAALLFRRGHNWSGDGGVIACMRSVRVCALLISVHTWVSVVLDGLRAPTIESTLDARVFNELWRRKVARLEREAQPRGAAQRRRWVREGALPTTMV